MSTSNYIRLQELVIDTFNLNAPVEIEKGALLLESTSKTVLLQLRLNVLDNVNEISSTSLKIYGFTDSGEPVEGFSPFIHTFSDVYLQGKKTFGDRTPIILDPRIRKVKVEIDKVVFRSGDTWRHPEGYFTPPTQKPLSSIKAGLLPQFERETRLMPEDFKQNFLYIPKQLDGFWLCTCGRPNKSNYEICSRCGLRKGVVFNITNEENLLRNLQKFNEDTRVAEEQEKKSASKKRWQLIITLITLVVIVALLSVFFFVIQPAIKYNQAATLLINKDFDGAISAFTALEDYKDSSELAKESTYQKAVDFLASKKFDEAIATFLSLSDYKDSFDMEKESTYQKGLHLFANNKFDESIIVFNSLGNYKDSSEMVKESTYQKGLHLFANSKFEESIIAFKSLGDYKDSSEMHQEAAYQKANDFLLTENYQAAIVWFTELGSYKESGNLLREAQYLLANRYISQENFYQAISVLEKIADYKDSNDLLMPLKYNKAVAFYDEGEFLSAKEVFQGIYNYQDSKSYLDKLEILINLQGTWVMDSIYNSEVWYGFKGWHYYWVTKWIECDYSEKNLTSTGLTIFKCGGSDYWLEYDYGKRTLMEKSTEGYLETYTKISDVFAP